MTERLGSWTRPLTPDRRLPPPGLLAALAFVASCGCSLMGLFDEVPPERCEPGSQRSAPCGVCQRLIGRQMCGADGLWEPPWCPSVDPDDRDGDLAASSPCSPDVPVDCNDNDPAIRPAVFDCVAGTTRQCRECGVPPGVQTCGDGCTWNPCALPAGQGACLIDGTCWTEGERAPTDPCWICDSRRATTSWSSVCWFDPNTGLMWQDPPGANRQDEWNDAFLYCDRLEYLGFVDWDLPTISELRSLIRGCPDTMTGGSCPVTDICLDDETCWHSDLCTGCEHLRGPGSGGCYWESFMMGPCGKYWSRSSLSSRFDYAWTVDFDSGSVSKDAKTRRFYVRCVRRGL